MSPHDRAHSAVWGRSVEADRASGVVLALYQQSEAAGGRGSISLLLLHGGKGSFILLEILLIGGRKSWGMLLLERRCIFGIGTKVLLQLSGTRRRAFGFFESLPAVLINRRGSGVSEKVLFLSV